MKFISADVCHEDDPEAGPAGYHETWERVPGTRDPARCWEYRFVASDGSGRKAFLLGAGDRFMFAADRPHPLPATSGKSGSSLSVGHASAAVCESYEVPEIFCIRLHHTLSFASVTR